jgi:hypothetical protein
MLRLLDPAAGVAVVLRLGQCVASCADKRVANKVAAVVIS